MELLQLRYFSEAARQGSFSKTAEKYMVPTTSVASSVKRLETELGCRLFDRTSNRILLNARGKELYGAVSSALGTLDRAVGNLQSREDDREITMLVRAMRSKITDAIIEFRREHPDVSFRTIYDFSRTDYENFDIVIDRQGQSFPDYESFPLYDMKIGLKVAAGSPLRGKNLTMAALREEPFVSLGEQSNMHRMLMDACALAGFVPKIAVFSNDARCHERLVEAGVGIGLSREDLEENNEKAFAYLKVSDFHQRYTVHAYCRKSADYGNVRKFLGFLKKP